YFFFSSRRRHTRSKRDWSSDVCSSDLAQSRSGARAAGLHFAALVQNQFMPEFPLPTDLPAPEDDGAADHLPGSPVPSVGLPGTDGSTVDPGAASGAGRIVSYAYRMTGRPGGPLPDGWDASTGARGGAPDT